MFKLPPVLLLNYCMAGNESMNRINGSINKNVITSFIVIKLHRYFT